MRQLRHRTALVHHHRWLHHALRHSAADHVARIERDLDVFPLLVMLGPSMLNGWPRRTARMALSRDAMNSGVRAAGHHHRRTGKRAVRLELDADQRPPVRRGFLAPAGGLHSCASRARNASSSLCDSCAASPLEAPSEIGRIEGVAGGREPLRRALVEQRLDLAWDRISAAALPSWAASAASEPWLPSSARASSWRRLSSAPRRSGRAWARPSSRPSAPAWVSASAPARAAACRSRP